MGLLQLEGDSCLDSQGKSPIGSMMLPVDRLFMSLQISLAKDGLNSIFTVHFQLTWQYDTMSKFGSLVDGWQIQSS